MEKEKIQNDQNGNDIHTKLLDAAEKLFAEKGFAATSVKDITELADCNIAAVNYHFQTKDNLYYKVFQRRTSLIKKVRMNSIKSAMSQGQTSLENLLRFFAKDFLEPFMGKSNDGIFLKLMMRERLDPQLSHALFFQNVIKPVTVELQKALSKIEPGLKEEKSLACIRSFIAQLILMIHIDNSASPEDQQLMSFWNNDINYLIEHIVAFTAAGIRGVKNIDY